MEQQNHDRFNFHRLNPDAYKSIDTPVNSFSFIQDVQSDLMYGEIKKEDIFLSVIIPTYQRKNLLAEALESVLQQEAVSFSWECIVIDNTPLDQVGMTPALEIMRRINDSRILYYHNRENIGSGYNWNRGVELSRGAWVMFLHDDDVLYSDALRNVSRIIHSLEGGKKPLGYIHARRDEFSDSGSLASVRRSFVPFYTPLTRLRALFLGESGTGAPSCGTTILKKAYMETGGINYDLGLTADAVLGYQMMPHYRVIISDYSLGAYRWAENETLKKDTLLGLLRSDFLFAQYRYSCTPFSRFWGWVLGHCEYQENIRYKSRDGRKKNIAITYKDIDEIAPYPNANPLTLCIYKVLQQLYRHSVAFVSWIQYCIGIYNTKNRKANRR